MASEFQGRRTDFEGIPDLSEAVFCTRIIRVGDDEFDVSLNGIFYLMLCNSPVNAERFWEFSIFKPGDQFFISHHAKIPLPAAL